MNQTTAWDAISARLDSETLHQLFRATCFSREWNHVAGIAKDQREGLYAASREEFRLPFRLVDVSDASAQFIQCTEKLHQIVGLYYNDTSPYAQKLDHIVHAFLPRPDMAALWTADHHKAVEILHNVNNAANRGVEVFDYLTKSFDILLNNNQVLQSLWLFMHAFGQEEGLEYYAKVLTIAYFGVQPSYPFKKWEWERLIRMCVSINKEDTPTSRLLVRLFAEGQRYIANPRSTGMRRDTAVRMMWRRGVNFKVVRVPDDDYRLAIREGDLTEVERWFQLEQEKMRQEFERYKRDLIKASDMLKRALGAKMAFAAFEFDRRIKLIMLI
eukprot:jgi/Mesvir1/1491/Mv14474-RA.1